MGVFTINAQHQDRRCPMILDLDPQLPNEATILGFLQGGMFYEPDVSEAMLRIIGEGDVVLDVGANVGFFTVLMGCLTGPNGRILGFEPGENNLARLKNNIRLNDLANVILVEQPATAAIEEVSFYVNSDNSGGNAIWDPGEFPPNVRSHANPRMIRMQSTTIDAEIDRLGLRTPRLIKIDTEGAEHSVLQGARGQLTGRKVPYVIAELHEFGLEKLGSSQRDLRRFMQGFGYDTFVLYFDGALPKLIPPETRLTSRYFLNLLFSTPEDVARLWKIENFDPTMVRRAER